MDARHFDALSRALSTGDTRRRLVGALTALPVLAGLLPALDIVDAEGSRRRRDRRKHQGHDHGLDAEKKHKKKKKNKRPQPPPPACIPEARATTCAGKCGSVTNNCGAAVDCSSCACDPPCDACFTCQEQGPNAPGTCVVDPAQVGESCGSDGKVCLADGSCACIAACDGKVCGPDGCGASCGACNGGQTCTTAGQCCTPTTCAAIDQEMCQFPGDCDYGICGTFQDECGGTLNCGGCSHSCFTCESNICTRRPGSSVCGTNCCINQCCSSFNQGVCGIQQTCSSGICCPLGFLCCDARDGSNRSSCFNVNTYCQGQGVVCCGAGNTCCPDEPCCTSDAQCAGNRRCIANGAPSSQGCCSFNF